ncbi:hypothetical protein [Brevundimonas viscosa]|uniref:Uncharacterized protein n=1 Tax=Brevundimonas viscosa TaxID=871741 RepID=A0A1I6T787_9CAUL|nr:hypothetical protein [Brevundimonas viscosa]SFS85079.1 hypothetical protein SAMN05192570_3030 [Brevundimonas viscosa]
MDTSELDRLIVQNLEDLDAVVHRTHAIEKVIWKHIGDAGRGWAHQHGWRASPAEDEDECWVAPPAWQARGRDFWFEVHWGPGDEDTGAPGEPWFSLCRLAGVGGGRLCLWLRWNGLRPGDWKAAAVPRMDEIRDAGFRLSDGRLVPYLDCTPQPGAVAQGLAEGDLSVAYAHLRDAFDAAARAVATFDPILKKAAR